MILPKKICVLFTLVALWASSCRKEQITQIQPDAPHNPYDSLTYGGGTGTTYPIDSTGFSGVYYLVLAQKCAQPACHDGSFEPDYRTIQSSYNTLVYAPVVKHTPGNDFTYRVVPGQPEKSWLHTRITTDDQTLGRMPLYDTLARWQIDMITDWISDGATDIFGNSPIEPNFQPYTAGIYAELPGQGGKRIDTARVSRNLSPFMVPHGEKVDIWFAVFDDKTLPLQMTDLYLRLSPSIAALSSAQPIPLIKETKQRMLPGYGGGGKVPYWLHAVVNTAQMKRGQVQYMQWSARDADHPAPTLIPAPGGQIYIQNYFAFIPQ